MKKLVFAAIAAAFVFVSANNVFASNKMTQISTAEPVDTVAPADTTAQPTEVAPVAEDTTQNTPAQTVEETTTETPATVAE